MNVTVKFDELSEETKEKLSKFSVNELCQYTECRFLEYWADKKPEILEKLTALAKYLTTREESLQVYDTYLFVLANSNQFKAAYDFVMRIPINGDKDVEYFVLRCLCDHNFYKEGYVSKERRISAFEKRLQMTNKQQEIEYIKSQLEKLKK